MPAHKPNDSDTRHSSTIRIPRTLHKRMVNLAKKERRSFNAQSVLLLELGIDRAEDEHDGK